MTKFLAVDGETDPASATAQIKGLGLGTSAPSDGLHVGVGGKLQVDVNGNILRINNVVTGWPSVQGAAGTVLTNNGSGALSWAPVSGVISGLTTNKLTKAISSTSIGDSQVFDNGTNVGIGTSTPAQKLDVAGTAQVSGFKMTTGAIVGYVLTTDAGGIGTWQPGGTMGGSGTTGKIAKFTAGAAVGDSVITELAGNIGVGNPSPATKLDVTGTVTATGLSSTGTITFGALGAGVGHLSAGGVLSSSAVLLGSEVSGTLDVAHGGTGIATTTAFGILAGGITGAGAFQNVGAGTSGQVLKSNGPSALPSWQAANVGTVTASGPPVAGQIPFWTSATDLTGDTGLTWDNTAKRLQTAGFKLTTAPTSGYVLTSDSAGIGTWQVATGGGGGSMSIGGAITSATVGSVLFAGTAGVLQQDNANLFWDDSNNRLGLGTASPIYPLDLVTASATPTARFRSTNTTYGPQFSLDASGAGGSEFRLVSAPSGNSTIGAGSFAIWDAAPAYRFVVTSAGAVGIGGTITSPALAGAKLVVTSGGDVGIGTTTPDVGGLGSAYRYLAVSNPTAAPIINFQSAATTNSDVGIFDFYNGTNRVAEMEVAGDGATDSGQYIFWTTPTGGSLSKRLAIRSNGDVQVGTTAQFTVTSSGDITKIKGASYVWPSAHAAGVLTSDSSGNLSWASSGGGGSVTASGPPAASQVAFWTSATDVTGSSNVTYGSGNLTLANDIYLNFGSLISNHLSTVFHATTVTTSYANSGGSGNRTGIIGVSATLAFTGTLSTFVDGAFTDVLFGGGSVSGLYLMFDFGVGAAKVITESKFYQSGTDTHGTFQWQGSVDGSTWNSIGTTFVLGGSATQTITTLSANTSGYRYYRILGVSGTISNLPWLREFEFKIGDELKYAELQSYAADGVTPGGIVALQTVGGKVAIGSTTATSLLNVGTTGQFQVSSSGDIVAIKGASYVWPSAHAAGVLTSDASGNLSWASAGGSMAIGGSITSATAGSVLFAGTSGVLSQDNTNFFWDNTTNQLLVGTTTAEAGYNQVLEVRKDQASNTRLLINNHTTTAGSQRMLTMTDSAADFNIGYSNGASYAGLPSGNYAFVQMNGATSDGMALVNVQPKPMVFGTNNTETFRLGAQGAADIATITGGTLASTKYALRVTATLPGNTGTTEIGSTEVYTGSGTGGNIQAGHTVTLSAGYTGSAPTLGLAGNNYSASTANNVFGSQYSTGIKGLSYGTGSVNVGAQGYAENAVLNVGFLGEAPGVGTNNVGVMGNALTGSTSNVGGYFTIGGAGNPTLSTAALIADNAAVAAPIFVARNNGTAVFTVQNTGTLLHKPSTNSTTAFQVQPSASTTPVLNVDTTNSRVGIGTNSPQGILDVIGSSATEIDNNFLNTNTAGMITFLAGESTSGGAYGYFGRVGSTAAAGSGQIWEQQKMFFILNSNQSGSDLGIAATATNGNIRFFTGGSNATTNERMRINSAGFVGIGTAAPDVPMSVAGAGAGSIVPLVSLLNTSSNAAGNGVELEFLAKDNTSTTTRIAAIDSAWEDASNNGYLSFGTRSGTLSERMRLTSAGLLLVGTSTPEAGYSQFMEVRKDQASPVRLLINNHTTSAGAARMLTLTDATRDFNIALNSTTSVFGLTTGHWASLQTNGPDGLAIGNAQSVPLVFATNNVERLRIYGTGTVSINKSITAGDNFEIMGDASTQTQVSAWDSRTHAAGVGGTFSSIGYTNGTTAASTFASWGGVKENGTSTDYAGAFIINTRVNGGSLTERVRVASTGAVTMTSDETVSGRRLGASASVTAANNLTLGATNFNVVSGATQVNLINATGWTAGSQVTLLFSGAPTVKHGQTVSGANKPILLSASTDFLAAADSILCLIYDGTSWHETSRKVA